MLEIAEQLLCNFFKKYIHTYLPIHIRNYKVQKFVTKNENKLKKTKQMQAQNNFYFRYNCQIFSKIFETS